MIDIHSHTNCSDGSEDVIEVLKKAEEKKLEYLSITDHNTCKAYEILENTNIKEYFSGNLIRGVELNAIIDGMSIELLGYGVDYKIINEETPKMYITKKQKNEIELNELCKICEKIGINSKDKLLAEYNSEEYTYASDYIHKKIVENPENRRFFTCDESWNDSLVFYRKEMSNKESLFYIDASKTVPHIKDVISLIKKAGGLIFVPHIYVYGNNSEIIFNKLIEKYKDDIDGFECFYSKFTKEQSEFLVKFCKENNLYISGGSDYHGKIKPNIELGTGISNNLNIDKEIIAPWVREEYLYK